MTRYEVAKRLKHAGFPQGDFTRCAGLDGGEIAFFPTLEELIEAVGAQRFNMNWDGYNPHYAFKGFGHSSNIMGQGSSFEEAVADLWIKIKDHCFECGGDRGDHQSGCIKTE